MSDPHGISTIICTYNRQDYIVQCLESIVRQTLDKQFYEILIVDNNSTDQTPTLCHEFMARYPNYPIRYVVEKEQGLSAARNRGIYEAHYTIVNYTDDDAEMSEGYLKAIFDYMNAHPNIWGLGGKIIAKYENDERPTWMSRYLEGTVGTTFLGETIKPYQKGQFPPGNNMTYRKTAFQQYGYFDNDLGPKGNALTRCDEKDIAEALQQGGHTLVYHPEALIYHHVPRSRLTDDYQRRQHIGMGISERKRMAKKSSYAWGKTALSYIIKLGAATLLAVKYLLAEQNYGKAKMIFLFRYYALGGYIGWLQKA